MYQSSRNNKNIGIGKDNSNPDRIYYNVAIPYNPIQNGISYARFQTELTDPIVDDPSQYYLSIIRFTIPTDAIPILIPDIEPFPNTDVTKTIYSVTLTYGAFSQTVPVYFIPEFQPPLVLQPPPLSASQPNQQDSPYYYIFTYNNFLEMINKSLDVALNGGNLGNPPVAYTGLKTLVGGAINAAVSPYFQFDSTTNLISLIAQISFFDETLATPIKIFTNVPLITFLDGLPVLAFGNFLPSGQDIQIRVYNQHNNFYNPPSTFPAAAPLFYKMTQDYNGLLEWNVFKNLLIESNLLPIIGEYSPVRNQGDLVSANTSIVNYRKIISDFEPQVQEGQQARILTMQYNLQSPYRVYDMNVQYPITKLDITISWVDVHGLIHPLILFYNQTVTIKLCFLKKTALEKY